MTTPSTAPLAALLASHPEECAAVVAVLATVRGQFESLCIDAIHAAVDTHAPGAMAEGAAILDVGIAGGWIARNPWREYRIAEEADRYTIARMGAAAWLAARVAPCG